MPGRNTKALSRHINNRLTPTNFKGNSAAAAVAKSFPLKLTVHYSQHHIFLTQHIRNIHVGRVRTSVDNPVHVKIQVIKLR